MHYRDNLSILLSVLNKHFYTPGPKVILKKSATILLVILSLLLFLKVSLEFISPYIKTDAAKNIPSDSDFTAYLTAANILKDHKIEQLYDTNIQKEYQEKLTGLDQNSILSFRNPPILAYIYLPYTFMEPLTAYRVNIFVQLILILTLVLLIYREVKPPKYVLFILLAFLPLPIQLYLGQIAPVIAIIFILILKYIKKPNWLVVGILAGLLFVKPQYLIVLPYLALLASNTRNLRKLLTGFLIVLGTLAALSSLLYGQDFIKNYLTFLINSENSLMGTRLSGNYNLLGLREFLIQNQIINLPHGTILLVTIILYIFSLYLLRKSKNKNISLTYSAVLLWTHSLNFHTIVTDLISLSIPLAVLFSTTIYGAQYKFLSTNKLKFLGIILLTLPLSAVFEAEGFASLVLLIGGFTIAGTWYAVTKKVNGVVGAPGLEPGTSRV